MANVKSRRNAVFGKRSMRMFIEKNVVLSRWGCETLEFGNKQVDKG